MTILEALNKITSSPKWYVQPNDLAKESTLRALAQRIRNGTAKPESIIKFFDAFGYQVIYNIKVIKND